MLEKYKLGKLVNVTRGASLSGDYYAEEGELIRLTLGNFDYKSNVFKENTSKKDIFYIGEVDDSFVLEKGDIITPLTEQAIGLLGSTARIPESGKYIQSQDVGLVKCISDKIDDSFLYYLLATPMVKQQLSAGAQQTSIRHTSPDKIKDCSVYIPDVESQRKIGKLLETLDRKIALNRKINAELEQMAKELYDYWFVQFDFPNAEGKPYKSSGGKMVYNPQLKRDIPEGWEVKKLSDVIITNQNGEWGRSERLDDDFEVHCVRGADIKTMIDLPIRFVPTSKTSKLLQSDDIIVEISGGSPTQSTGRSNYVCKELLAYFNGRITCSNFCQYIRLKKKYLAPYFFKTWNLFFDNGNMFNYEGKTSGIRNLQIGELLSERWYFPPIDLTESFSLIFSTIKAIETNNQIQNQELKQLRDQLLPLLMNGQVTIK